MRGHTEHDYVNEGVTIEDTHEPMLANDEERLEAAIRNHALAEWSEYEIEGMVQYAVDIDEEDRDDPSHLAHALWTMGAHGPKHKKCRVEDESSYKNTCDPCQAFLLDLAAKIIATYEQTSADVPTGSES